MNREDSHHLTVCAPESSGQSVELVFPNTVGFLLHSLGCPCEKGKKNRPAEQFDEDEVLEHGELRQPMLGRTSGIRIASKCLAKRPPFGQQLALAFVRLAKNAC